MAGRPPGEGRHARTVLEHLLWAEDATYEEVVARFERAAFELGERATLTPRHLRRLASGERTAPTPVTRRVLQVMFGQSVETLLSPWHGQSSLATSNPNVRVATANNREMITMAANRARNFQLASSGTNLTAELIDQLYDDVANLAVAYQQEAPTQYLDQLVETQESLFTLLEGRQPPAYTRRLLLLAGVSSGILAKISHDFGDSSAALTQSRTAFLCADNADHNGMRAWIKGLQSVIAYWAGRYHEAVRYAQQGASFAAQNTTAVWLPVSEARAWAALGNARATTQAIQRAEDSWDRVTSDEVDELGGFCTFSRTRQLYYAADAFAWLPSEAAATERYSLQALEAYADSSKPDWAFGDAAGAATDLAIARVELGQVEGAQEAMQSVLALPPSQRIQGVTQSVRHVQAALIRAPKSATGTQLEEQIETFVALPISALPR